MFISPYPFYATLIMVHEVNIKERGGQIIDILISQQLEVPLTSYCPSLGAWTPVDIALLDLAVCRFQSQININSFFFAAF